MSQSRDAGQTSERSQQGGTQRTEQSAEGGGQQGEDKRKSTTDWFANTAVRAGLTIIGVILLLFALGQAVGLPLLDLVTDAVTSQTGQWLVVAFFAILLIAAAQKGLPTN